MPHPAALAAAVAAVRSRRRAIGAASTVLGTAWLVPLAVIIVAMAGAPGTAELARSTGIPGPVLDAYRHASEQIDSIQPRCRVRWQVLAGIGRVESNHADGHTISSTGEATPPIIGVALDGTGGTAAIPDTDRGRYDGDTRWDRAVGPMQFIPTSWATYGQDGNGDGVADPHNIYDAALGAAVHLCGGRPLDLDDDTTLRDALLRYNRSHRYVEQVIAWITHYDHSIESAPAGPEPGLIVAVGGIEVDSSIAAPVGALLRAAEADGVHLAGGGYRSHEAQIRLRRAHCGTSHHAIYDLPASACTPPTARPGTSMHERGLAIDFTCDGRLIRSRSNPCYQWLAANAPSYGLHELRTGAEPWHWSTNGR